jgi:hypothetical protein
VSPTFTINFRREAYRLERARTRRRAVAVGTWVAYFGVLALLLGLYALNLGSVMRRTRQLEAQSLRLRASDAVTRAWKPSPADVTLAERTLANPRLWHTRLVRLAAVLPSNVRLTEVVVNPDNLANPSEQDRLLLVGELRPLPGQDRMRGIMDLVQTLHADRVFAAQYRTIRLVESSAGEGGASAAFRIECR